MLCELLEFWLQRATERVKLWLASLNSLQWCLVWSAGVEFKCYSREFLCEFLWMLALLFAESDFMGARGEISCPAAVNDASYAWLSSYSWAWGSSSLYVGRRLTEFSVLWRPIFSMLRLLFSLRQNAFCFEFEIWDFCGLKFLFSGSNGYSANFLLSSDESRKASNSSPSVELESTLSASSRKLQSY